MQPTKPEIREERQDASHTRRYRYARAIALAAVMTCAGCQSTAADGEKLADGGPAGKGGSAEAGAAGGRGGQDADGPNRGGTTGGGGNTGGGGSTSDAAAGGSITPARDAAGDAETARDVASETARDTAGSGETGGNAAVIWDGNATKGTGVFGTLNVETGATITAVADPNYGTVWRFHKPIGSRRCESSHLPNELHAKEGDVWFIGWRYKVVMPQDATTNAIFQWKAYPADGQPSLQNFPVVLKTFAGELQLLYHNPSDVSEFPWTSKTVVNEWTTIVLKLMVSRDPKVGYIEFWHNGVQQTLKGGVTRYPARTLDGGYTDPKWGIYGAEDIEATNYVHGMKIASTYEGAAPQ